MKKMKKVAIFGSVGVNRGDDLMNRVLVNYFMEHEFNVSSASMCPEKMNELYGGTYFSSRILHIAKWISEIRSSDVVIIGGGTVIQDDFGKKIGGILTYTAAAILISKIFGKKVHVIGVGINEIKRNLSKLLIQIYRLVDTITVRDASSLKLANERAWLKGKIFYAPDLAFSKKHYGFQLCELKPDIPRRKILISLVGESHKSSAFQLLNTAYKICKINGADLVGIAMDERETEEISIYKEFSKTNDNFHYVVPKTIEDAVREISSSEGIISMRLHASIISLVLEKSLLVVSRETKTEWIKDWIPKELFVNISQVGSGFLEDSLYKLLESVDSIEEKPNKTKIKNSEYLINLSLKKIV
jgi:polysaccharide pyruvyl transferase WcaK-like protein